MNLTLYHYWRSSSSWRVRWALAIKGLQSKFVHVDLLSGESEQEPHLSRNPLGYVPVLNVDGQNLIESVAIIEWLEENFSTPTLYPGDTFNRAQIRTLAEIINADTQPVQNLNVVDRLPEDQRAEWKDHFIRRGFQAYEKIAAKSAGKFSVGDSVCAADLFLIPQCYNALRGKINLNDFPLIERIYQAALQTEQCQAAHPDRYKP